MTAPYDYYSNTELFNVGDQFLDRGRESGDVLHIRGDDQLGRLAVGYLL